MWNWLCETNNKIRLKPSPLVEKLYRLGDAYLPPHVSKILDYRFAGSNNGYYVDFWSVTHFVWGMIINAVLGWFRLFNATTIYVMGFILHTLWELFQVMIGMSTFCRYHSYRPFGLADTILDTLFFMFGMVLMNIIRKTMPH
jgi:hypothetical protein